MLAFNSIQKQSFTGMLQNNSSYKNFQNISRKHMQQSPLLSKVPGQMTFSIMVFFRENNEISQKKFTKRDFSKSNFIKNIICGCFTMKIMKFSTQASIAGVILRKLKHFPEVFFKENLRTANCFYPLQQHQCLTQKHIQNFWKHL